MSDGSGYTIDSTESQTLSEPFSSAFSGESAYPPSPVRPLRRRDKKESTSTLMPSGAPARGHVAQAPYFRKGQGSDFFVIANINNSLSESDFLPRIKCIWYKL